MNDLESIRDYVLTIAARREEARKRSARSTRFFYELKREAERLRREIEEAKGAIALTRQANEAQNHEAVGSMDRIEKENGAPQVLHVQAQD